MTHTFKHTAAAMIAALSLTAAAGAGSTFYYSGGQGYQGLSDSPFAAGDVHLENFEDGLFNLAGVTANKGSVKNSSSKTDSVDGDDGDNDGWGKQGKSYKSGSSKSITFTFAQNNGANPTAAGLVWTDGHANSKVTFKAWNSSGELIGKITKTVGDMLKTGSTAEDRFFGLVSDDGISKIKIISNYKGFEIDHLQFAYGFAVVPIPAPLALGAAGLAAVALGRGMKRRRAAD